jgi:hypothetical protein
MAARSDNPRQAYNGDLPGSRRSPCLGCDKIVVTARDAHVPIGGRRDGSLLVEIDVEPLISQSNDPDALYKADDLYLLGVAHRDCVPEARRRLQAGEVELPHDLPQLKVDDQIPQLPALHLPPSLERCPFCDRADPTDEHVFPQWLSKELAALGGLVDRGAEHGPRPLRKIDITAPVCGMCNNRWLSVLENDAKPLLSRMLRGEQQRLFHKDQKLLATWALKTAMMLDLASGAAVIPSGFFQAVRQRREPFPSSVVFIGAYNGMQWATWARHMPLQLGAPETQPPLGFVSTFTVFRVVFQVFAHFTSGGANMNDNRIYRDALAQIAPLRCLPVEWPPNGLAFNDDWLETLATSIADSEDAQSLAR